MPGHSNKHFRRTGSHEVARSQPTSPRVRWRHRARSARAPEGTGHRTSGVGPIVAALDANTLDPPQGGGGTDEPWRSGNAAATADDVAPKGELVTALAAFAETAFTARQQAVEDAERIRREADAYAEARRVEAERVLDEARRRVAEVIGIAGHEGMAQEADTALFADTAPSEPSRRRR